MKTTFTYWILLLLSSVLMISCQKEIEEINPIDDSKVVTVDAPLFSLMGKTSLRDGSFDDVLDHNPCISIKLPVTITIDTLVLTINSETELGSVRNALKKYDLEPEDIEYTFPITVILSDYSELLINNKDELDNLEDACEALLEDEDIECIDFVYPIKISVYNETNELLSTVTISSDEEFYSFLESRDTDDYLGFEFPLQLIAYDGTVLTINNNIELQNAIEVYEDSCDEEDDYMLDGINDGEFISYLTEGEWKVGLFYKEEDLTATVSDYNLVFEINELINLADGTLAGEWETGQEGDTLLLYLDFDGDEILEQMNRSWKVISQGTDQIVLSHSGFAEFLVLERDSAPSESALESILLASSWFVELYLDNGNDETTDFEGWTMSFSENQQVTVTDTNDVFEGTWISVADKYFILEFSDNPFDQLSDTWIISAFDQGSLTVEIPRDFEPDFLLLTSL